MLYYNLIIFFLCYNLNDKHIESVNMDKNIFREYNIRGEYLTNK